MPNYYATKEFNYNAQDIYNLIMDIESYNQFLPWCSNSRVISANSEITIAELSINYKGYYDKYISKIITKKSLNNYQITTQAISGPFKYLNNKWNINNTSKGCLVSFSIELELKRFLFNKILSSMFVPFAQQLAVSFETRANNILSNDTNF